MKDEHLWFTGVGIFAIFILLLEPYGATRSMFNYFILAAFVGLIALAGIGAIIIGVIKFVTKGEGIWLATAAVFLTFVIVATSLPIELLLG